MGDKVRVRKETAQTTAKVPKYMLVEKDVALPDN